LKSYREGTYAPFPRVIAETLTGEGVTLAAMIALAATEITRRHTTSHKDLIDEHRWRRYKIDQSDGLHPWTIAQNETAFLASYFGRPTRASHDVVTASARSH
jgi:hypothetical protein